jgi:hypothetical protein
MSKKSFVLALKEDKYFLPTLNWALFTSLCSVIALYYLGITLGLATTILSALVLGPLNKFSPNVMQVLTDWYKELGTSTHLGLFITQVLILSGLLFTDKIRNKIWQIIQSMIQNSK